MFKFKLFHGNDTDTFIGEGTVVEGKIITRTGIRIEGNVIGDIECASDITVGEKAVLKSNIATRNITIAGTIMGNVVSSGTISITETGQLIGSIESGSFILSEGGVFQGNSKMAPKTAEQMISSKKERRQTKKGATATAT